MGREVTKQKAGSMQQQQQQSGLVWQQKAHKHMIVVLKIYGHTSVGTHGAVGAGWRRLARRGGVRIWVGRNGKIELEPTRRKAIAVCSELWGDWRGVR